MLEHKKKHHFIKICLIIVSMEIKQEVFGSPLDKVEKNNNLKLILKSHHWPKLIKPTKWSNNNSWYSENDDFMEMPDKKK